jgi:very-short-patch-repair endonuclease
MSKALTTKDFIEKSKAIHADLYDYSNCTYINKRIKVNISCRLHGLFSIWAMNHLNGSGCLLCKRENKRTPQNEFIKQVNIIHNFKYDYSKVIYKNNRTKIVIICPEHGEFQQTPDSHLTQKSGCPKCQESKGEKAVRIWLRDNNFKFEEQKTYIDLYHKDKSKLLRFDFYLPDYNLLIEFDGTQHYCPSYPKNNKEKAITLFETVKQRDEIKNQYCINNKIKLLRIPYWKIKSVDKVLERELL